MMRVAHRIDLFPSIRAPQLLNQIQIRLPNNCPAIGCRIILVIIFDGPLPELFPFRWSMTTPPLSFYQKQRRLGSFSTDANKSRFTAALI